LIAYGSIGGDAAVQFLHKWYIPLQKANASIDKLKVIGWISHKLFKQNSETAWQEFIDLLKFLLENGANPTESISGENPIEWLSFKIFINNKGIRKDVISTTKYLLQAIDLLASYTDDINNAKTAHGYNDIVLLEDPVEYNAKKVVEILLRNGADPNVIKHGHRNTFLLSIAVSRGHLEIAELLKKYGAK